MIKQIVDACYQLQIQCILVEGGSKLLQSIIDIGLWDEARVIVNKNLVVNQGLRAPVLSNQSIIKSESLFSDTVTYFSNKNMGNKA
ncbi:MAG: hypothetical protein H7101_09680 [Deinococcales bacterium]|nr:hypothetical protein [Chitinophagaceae bacterium]